MGKLAVRVAEIARKHYPGLAVPVEVSERVAELSACAADLARVDQEVLLSGESGADAYSCPYDGVVDDLHRQLLSVLIDPGSTSDLDAGVDVAVLSEIYEQFAEHAAQIARRVAYETNDHHCVSEPLAISS
jgi:phosphate transport system protein